MENVLISFPSIEVCCPYCGYEVDVDGDEFEKSLSISLFAEAVVFCDACEKNFCVQVG